MSNVEATTNPTEPSGATEETDLSLPNNAAGYRATRITDTVRQRPIHLDYWYPAAPGSRETAIDYQFGVGTVAQDAPLATGPHPLVMLSHGSMGSASNYSWIAEHLARSGFVVVGVSHYGESPVYGPETLDFAAATRLWERPLDVTSALDHTMAEPFFAGSLSGRVGIIGHSAGGATAIALAGAAFTQAAVERYCASPAAEGDLGCAYEGDGAGDAQPTTADPRIDAAVALDPALGPGFTPDALAAIDVPVLVVGATRNDFLPHRAHAGHYAAHIPGARSVELADGEGHFVFLDTTDLQIEVMGIGLGEDRPGIDRRAVHDRLGPIIAEFLRGELT
ncbi:MAG: dienelactone hydrolase family protein [Actinomycetota bacterium]